MPPSRGMTGDSSSQASHGSPVETSVVLSANSAKMRKTIENCVLWLVFFLICLGLGYPTLNRYDPRKTGGLSDTTTYYELAARGPANADPQNRYRLLIQLLARPVARMAA